MNHFGSELRFGLVKNTNQDTPFMFVEELKYLLADN